MSFEIPIGPKKGSALLFFLAAGGIPNVPFDIRTLHCGEVVAEDASHDKWIPQLWLRKGNYKPTAPQEIRTLRPLTRCQPTALLLLLSSIYVFI